MEKKEGAKRILIFEADARRFGLFEDEIARVKRYSDKALASLGSGNGEEVEIRSFREYLSIPEDLYGNKPFLICPRRGRELLTVDTVWRKRRVKIYDIFPTRFDYIKEVLVDGQRIPLFNLIDLLEMKPPFEKEVLDLVRKGGRPTFESGEGDASTEVGVSDDSQGEERASDHEEGDLAGVKGEGAVRKKRNGGLPYVMFSFSLVILILMLFAIIRAEHVEGLPFRFLPSVGRIKSETQAVGSFLTYQSKRQMQTSVYELLKKKREDLHGVEVALTALEAEKNRFLRTMESGEVIFEENLSVFDIDESYRWLRSIVDLVREKVEFEGEAQRRKEQFLKLYERKRSALLAEKREYERQMAELTAYMQTITAEGSNAAAKGMPSYQEVLYLDELKQGRINRFLFALEKEDYEGAIRILESTAGLPFADDEKTIHILIVRTLRVLQDYRERLTLLHDNGPFDDIKISFLNENYAETRNRVTSLAQHEYIKPLLSGLEGSLVTNMEISRKIDDELALRGKVRELTAKAALLEKGGEYEKAVQTYEDLLVFPLPTYDREFILEKVHELWLDVELKRVKREENTQAIRYLESARMLNREGKEEDALKYYRQLLLECPHSDFVKDAIEELMLLSPASKGSR